eukprot:761596-Hanusia_phi.AAC.5
MSDSGLLIAKVKGFPWWPAKVSAGLCWISRREAVCQVANPANQGLEERKALAELQQHLCHESPADREKFDRLFKFDNVDEWL